MLGEHRGSGVELVSLSLTVPSNFGSVREAAQRFVHDFDGSPHAGALLAIDRRPDGSEHLHGPGLMRDRWGAVGRWCDATGADLQATRCTVVTGWDEFVRGDEGKLATNLHHPFKGHGVIDYAFKPWPEGQGERDIDLDVFASGPFAPPWAAHRARDGAEAAPGGGDALQGVPGAENGARVCPHCGRPIPATMRSDAKWCSPRCRKAASKARGARTDGPHGAR